MLSDDDRRALSNPLSARGKQISHECTTSCEHGDSAHCSSIESLNVWWRSQWIILVMNGRRLSIALFVVLTILGLPQTRHLLHFLFLESSFLSSPPTLASRDTEPILLFLDHAFSYLKRHKAQDCHDEEKCSCHPKETTQSTLGSSTQIRPHLLRYIAMRSFPTRAALTFSIPCASTRVGAEEAIVVTLALASLCGCSVAKSLRVARRQIGLSRIALTPKERVSIGIDFSNTGIPIEALIVLTGNVLDFTERTGVSRGAVAVVLEAFVLGRIFPIAADSAVAALERAFVSESEVYQTVPPQAHPRLHGREGSV